MNISSELEEHAFLFIYFFLDLKCRPWPRIYRVFLIGVPSLAIEIITENLSVLLDSENIGVPSNVQYLRVGFPFI